LTVSPTLNRSQEKIPSPNNSLKNFTSKISVNGRIQVSKKGWAVRIAMLAAMVLFSTFRFYTGINLEDPFIIYSTIAPAITILMFVGAWCWYRSPAKGTAGNNLVSVIIPVYNQKDMIEIVIDAIYRSTYKNIEVVAINDGSNDGTKEILDNLTKKYPTLQVIHQNRAGKRKATATGFYASKGKYLVHIDSDSVIDEQAIAEIMKTFNANPKVGSLVGEMRIWNAEKNVLTKLQDAWFNISCNISKAYESSFRSVTCCSGPLSAFRREAIANFMPYWANTNTHSGGGVDRELTAYIIASKEVKNDMLQTLWPSSALKQKLMESTSKYDDSDDRLLTAHSLIKWESAYVATAIVYVEAQQTLKKFLKQQTRWKKGFLRVNFYLSTYFWRGRHPLASTIYYLEFMSGLTQSFIILTVVFYEPFIVNDFWTPLYFIGGLISSSLAHGLDLKLRYPCSKNWLYMPLMNLFGTFVLSWLLFYAIWSFKNNSWGTR
jgi:hyaluronan synthase